jgi:hypothetical protein
VNVVTDAGVLRGESSCQEKGSDEEEGDDGEGFVESLEDEEHLMEATCDVMPPLARCLTADAFMPFWTVRRSSPLCRARKPVRAIVRFESDCPLISVGMQLVVACVQLLACRHVNHSEERLPPHSKHAAQAKHVNARIVLCALLHVHQDELRRLSGVQPLVTTVGSGQDLCSLTTTAVHPKYWL